MAVWGQGDPRWLVEHREDGKNVNNWHWSEVNRMEWTKTRLAELLRGVESPPLAGADGGVARVTQVKSVTGEAMLTTRKGNKRFAYYDLKITLGWEAIPLAPPPPPPPTGAGSDEGDAKPSEQAATSCAGLAAEVLEATSLSGGIDIVEEQEEDVQCASAAAAEDADGMAPAAGAAPAAVTGEITVEEFGSGSDHDDLELMVTASGGDASERERLRRHAQATLWPLVLQQLEQYVRELGEA